MEVLWWHLTGDGQGAGRGARVLPAVRGQDAQGVLADAFAVQQ